MTTISNARSALASAITNDRAGLVSERDAEKIVDGAVQDIARAHDPESAFEAGRKTIDAAAILLGQDRDAKDVLGSFATRGTSALALRLSELSGDGALPSSAKEAFAAALREAGTVDGDAAVTLSNVQGNDAEGYTFRYQAGGAEGEGFALRQGGAWLFAPQKVTREQLDVVTEVAKTWFDESWKGDLVEMGLSEAEIAAARDAIAPERAFFPGESDPYDLVSSYPLVFSMKNETGSDHGFYVGFDPSSGATEVYIFN